MTVSLDFIGTTCQTHTAWAHKSHLLDPVISAGIAKRLDQVEPTSLLASLCLGHAWKVSQFGSSSWSRVYLLETLSQANEITRHLSSIFAHDQFKPRILVGDESARKHQTALIRLVIALSFSSIPAAAGARVIEKMMPFYGGTLSDDDQSLLDLFQRIELVVGGSVSIAMRAWNPSLDLSPPETSRAGTFAALQLGYVRRSWLRVSSSSRTVFPAEHANITYDPRFLLPLLCHAIAEEEMKGADWLGILETGVLGLAVAALASSSNSLRSMAQATLANVLVKVEVRSISMERMGSVD